MNEKKQAIILLSVVLLLLAGLFLFRVQQLESQITNLHIESDARELHTTVHTIQTYSYAKYRERIKNLLNANPEIIEAFAQRARTQLYELTKSKYDSLKRENSYFHIMQFHLPDGTVFLRMQQADFFGDPLDGCRPMVSAVHQGQTTISGFEFGREGLFFRIVHPIFVQERYVGAVEIGISANEVVEAIEETLDEKIIRYFQADLWEKATLLQNQPVTKVGNFVIRADNASRVKLLSPEFYDEKDNQIIKQDGRSFKVHSQQIFSNYKNDSIGGILFFQDITESIQNKQTFFWEAALATLLLFLVASVVLYISFERILGSLIKEIAVRKQKESDILDKEERIRLLLDSTAEGIFGLDHEGKCTFVNKSCLKLLGYEHENDLLGDNLHDLIHYRRPDGTNFPKTECPMCRSYRDGQEVSIDNEVLWSKNGRALPVEYHAYPIKHDGLLLGSVVSFSDISRRKQAEDDKERLAAAIEHAADEIIITNLNGVIEYVNPAFERVTGYTREEAVGQNPSILKSGKHSIEYYHDLWKTIKSGKVWSNRIINKTKSNALIEEDATISPIFDASGHTIGYVAVKRDVTEKVKMEGRLLQASKMESLGTLAGAIAHDFNNILNGIIGFTSLSLMDLPAESQVAENMTEVKRAAKVGAELVRQINAFSRKGSTELKPVAVQDIVKDVVKLLRCTMPKRIKIDMQLDMECGPIWGNGSQIHQIIMNLGTNAYHAMREKGGELTMQLVEKAADTQLDRGIGARFVQLSITDTGYGIAPDDLTNIFEPYFTTKKEGEGTGLGLATVQEIVKSYQGKIEVHSELGKGTTFTLQFPVYQEEMVAKETEESISSLPESAGHVLFVDDVAFNVILGQEILQSGGFKVTGLSDSSKALEVFRERPEEFDLVVTDLMMPGMNGAELTKEIKQIRKDIPIIMLTGDEEPSRDIEFDQCDIGEFLEKPLRVDSLLGAAERSMRSAASQF